MFKHVLKCKSIEDCKTVKWYLGRIVTVISPKEYDEITTNTLEVVSKQKVYNGVINFLQSKYSFEILKINEELKEN